MSTGSPLSGRARLYRRARSGVGRLLAAADAGHTGLWLGLLDHRDLHALDQARYEASGRYRTDGHNRRGLFDWEEQAVRAHFPAAGALLVLGAGGGREVLALARAGYAVTGYECNPVLLDYGRDLLARSGCAGAELRAVARDEAPRDGGRYDGIVVGWSSYMLVPGRDRRVALLRGLRPRVPAGAPVLVSFFSRSPGGRREQVVAAVADPVRRLRGARPVDLGDDLVPDFVHRFTRAEIAAELSAGGFGLRDFRPQGPGPFDSGFAVGTAR